ncbi:CMGC/DYRK/PRP4 protein kinase Prp4 [Schizosaccharomyces japonicus yFS275]|uniref:non-specific serine/threonine protein kinase n=1 Tax=Schizosaccharomyces japonicus (strain yFS275 / FY16936) TaxID=402676 RepID=B6JXB3_SCHJY|nr:CMGC/DYRK/PRP4 protein kinase Prp4 [Schizosaccharomyces japonicus yFS275]EEB06014.1 CMGC/DYRK/PRP4 protein kinase Prp4 [Schizosaccharomyces japonicus yFS275]
MSEAKLTEDEIIEQRRLRRRQILLKYQNVQQAGEKSTVTDNSVLQSKQPVIGSEEKQSLKRPERNEAQNDQTNAQQQPRDEGKSEPALKKAKTIVKEDDDDDEEEEEDDMFADTPTRKTKHRKEASSDVAVTRKFGVMEDVWDDLEGYYKVVLLEELDGRYVVQSNLGKGVFSSVVKVLDQKTGKLFAVKIIRNNETMYKAGLKEISIFERLKQADENNSQTIVHYERNFMHKHHLCMVFEMLSLNLRDILKKFGRGVGLNIKAVRVYAYQMFKALILLKKCNILHADIKPDNMLVNEKRNLVKICDLGSASDASENEITPYLVSRFYRAPEIILGIPYSFPIDIWSVACSIFELYTGHILFAGRSNNQMLKQMMECKGHFSHKVLKRGQFTNDHFDEHYNFISVEIDPITGREIRKPMNFVKPTNDLKSRVRETPTSTPQEGVIQNDLVLLLDRCLELNPEKRLTPEEALEQPFFKNASLFR